MASALLGVVSAQRLFNRGMHHVAGIALITMLAIQVVNIVGRKGFQFPILGTVEITQMLLAVVVFLGLAYSEDLGDHITIDLIHVRLGPRMKAVFDVFSNLVSMVVVGLMSWRLFEFASFTRLTGEDTGILDWPLWVFVVVTAVGAALYALAVAVKFVLRALGEPVEVDAPATLGEIEAAEL